MSGVKSVLITGGSRGIGRGAALAMARAGYDVAFSFTHHAEAAEETAAEVRALGRRCCVYQATLEQPGAAEKLFEEAVAEFSCFHALFSSAGRTMLQSILHLTAEQLDYLYNLDYRSHMILASLVARNMVEHGIRGSILFNTSSRGGRAYPGDAVYGGLKAALNRGVQSMALDLAVHGIRVNAIAPGATASSTVERHQQRYDELAPRIPLQRMGKPDDIGQAVVWLSSDNASYITGQTLVVDGGLTLPGMPESPFDYEAHGWNRPSGYGRSAKPGETHG